MDAEKRQKYFVNHQEAVTIRCKSCGRVGTFSVAGLRGQKHSLKVNCPCTEIFAIDLEFRHDYRRATHIPATFRALSTPKGRARQCVVANQSSGGILLHIEEDVPVKTNDRLVVCFRSQDEITLELERVITVRHYEHGSRIGGAFIDALQPPPLTSNSIHLH
ncbi:MAG: hypothetical protein PHI97_27955 [Desulfobulbus sp.]|nr:hypothetical protein [Desulfobulbus sp.]